MKDLDDAFFLKLAYAEAVRSIGRSTQNGAVVVNPVSGAVLGTGFNDIFPATLRTPERYERPAKYLWTEHAERAAIYQAALFGRCLAAATLYCPWLACADCGRAIVLAGISRVVRHKIPQHATRPDWQASIAVADEMFLATGVEVAEYEGVLGVTFRFNGVEIEV